MINQNKITDLNINCVRKSIKYNISSKETLCNKDLWLLFIKNILDEANKEKDAVVYIVKFVMVGKTKIQTLFEHIDTSYQSKDGYIRLHSHKAEQIKTLKRILRVHGSLTEEELTEYRILTSEMIELEDKINNFKNKNIDNSQLKKVINYLDFCKILNSYFYNVGTELIKGKRFNLLNQLGYLEPRRIERSHSHKVIVKSKSFTKDKKLVENPVYYTDSEYLRIAWDKSMFTSNIESYSFKPAKGEKDDDALGKRFSQLNIKNKYLKMKYRYFPFNSMLRKNHIANIKEDGI